MRIKSEHKNHDHGVGGGFAGYTSAAASALVPDSPLT
jgi:hypothetical protein